VGRFDQEPKVLDQAKCRQAGLYEANLSPSIETDLCSQTYKIQIADRAAADHLVQAIQPCAKHQATF
jgi:hypothetical protein